MGTCSSNCNNCQNMHQSNVNISDLNKGTMTISTYFTKEEHIKIYKLQNTIRLYLKKKIRIKPKLSTLFKIKSDPIGISLSSNKTDYNIKKFKEIIEDNTSYIGQWKNQQRNGLGIMKWGTSKYIGEFTDNYPNGYGKLIDGKHACYIGTFCNFNAHGIGKSKNKSRILYEGEWKDNQPQGFGCEKSIKETTSSFIGEYSHGKMNGIGILHLKEADGYEGEMVNDELSGIGTFYFSDKRKYQGQWKNNKMNGYGIITWPDGKVFEGHFKNDHKDGFGIFLSIGKVYLGIWKNNKLIGKVIIITNGKIIKQLWANGKVLRNLPLSTVTFYDKIITSDIIKYSMNISHRTTKSNNSNFFESNVNTTNAQTNTNLIQYVL